jgi:DNA ligase (NAD+)
LVFRDTMPPRKAAAAPEPLTVPWIKTLTEGELADWIVKADVAYYEKGDPIASDDVYDLMRAALKRKNKHHPILQKVGAVVEQSKKKVKLPYWMGSMDKIKNDVATLDKWKKTYKASYMVSDKLDGVSGLVYVKDGKVALYTRGDGREGQDISSILPYIQVGIPCDLATKYPLLAVRGELILSKDAFTQLVDQGNNPRNMVAGVLNAKTPNMKIVQHLEFVSYEWIAPGGPFTAEHQMEQLLRGGFRTVAYKTFPSEESMTSDTLSEYLMKRRAESPYEIDGLVVYSNATAHPRTTSGNPKYAFAFKSMITLEKAEVMVTEVQWNVSKDKYLKPIVKFEPVRINQVNIKQATGFNAKFIKDNMIGPGARILIVRSGDVIPFIDKVIKPAEQPQMPLDTVYVWTDTGVDILLDTTNEAHQHQGVAAKELQYFFEKLNVKGVSKATIQKVYDAGYTTVEQVLALTKDQLLELDGIKEKTASNITTAIKQAMNDVDLITLMVASNQFGRGFGEKRLSQIFEAMPEILSAKDKVPSVDTIVALPGFEQKTARKFVDNYSKFWEFVHANHLEDIVKTKIAAYVKADGPSRTTSGIFHDRIFVFTGFRNADLEKKIKEQGGDVATSLTKKTTDLITKNEDESSSKIENARTNGTRILSLSQLYKLYKAATVA